MALVTGHVDDMHSSASSAYSHAEQAGGQSSAVAVAMTKPAAIPPVVVVGPAADQMRAFGGQLRLRQGFLTLSGFVTAHRGQVEAALGSLNSGRLDSWTNDTLAPPLPEAQAHQLRPRRAPRHPGRRVARGQELHRGCHQGHRRSGDWYPGSRLQPGQAQLGVD